MSDKQPAVVVKSLYKTFRLPHEQHNGVKQFLINFNKQKKGYESQHVLSDISFEIKKGEFFGIVGRNGSGKSTLLKLLAGIYAPDKGLVHVEGSLTPFIELGVGFNAELTGRENIFMNGALLGFDHAQMEEMYDDIVDFAELEKFMDQKLKNYSSGMQVRLAFSIAIRAKSDVLLIDEVLAVGDAAFQAKCFDYFYKLKKSNTTVIFISHDKTSLERFCDRGILINDGRIIAKGPITEVLKSYSKVVLGEMRHTDLGDEEKANKKKPLNTSTNITNTYTTDGNDKKQEKFSYGDDMYANFNITFRRKLTNPIFGITLWQKNITEKPIYATNTLLEGVKETGVFNIGDKISFKVKLPLNINDGEYTLEPAIANESGTVFYDQIPEASSFFVVGSVNPYALLSSGGHIKLTNVNIKG